MNKHIDENEELMPWLANESLSGEERLKVQQYVKGNPQAEKELEFLEALRNSVKDEQMGSPGAFGLRRLQNAIREDKEKNRTIDPSVPPANDNRWWKMSVAAAAVVIMVQGGVLFNIFGEQPDQYQPLSVQSGESSLLQVEFQPQATEAQIRDLLISINATIVEGPSAVGLYRLQLDKGNLSDSINLLKQAEGVVKYVEEN